MIDKKNTAQMIDLVFHTDRFDPGADFFTEFTALVLPAETNPPVTLQECRIIRKAHASLFPDLRFSFLKDDGVDQDETVRCRIALRNIHDRDGFGNTDLRRSDADPLRLAFHDPDQSRHKLQE